MLFRSSAPLAAAADVAALPINAVRNIVRNPLDRSERPSLTPFSDIRTRALSEDMGAKGINEIREAENKAAERVGIEEEIDRRMRALEKEAISDVNLAETKQELSDLEKTAQSLTLVGDQRVTHVPTREAPYRQADITNQLDLLENRRQQRLDVINKSTAMSAEEKAALNDMVNNVSDEMQRLHLHRDALTKFIDQAQAQVRVAEAQQRVEAANARLQQPGLFPDERARLLGEVRQKAQSDLTAARRQAGALGREYSAALKRSKEAERAAKAVERARTEAASVQRSKAQQARLERMQAPPGLASPPQVEIPAKIGRAHV